MSTQNSSFVESILDQLFGVSGIDTRRMFGGVGIYRFGVMFALVVDERLFFKVGPENKNDYQAAGSVPFVYDRHDKKGINKPVALSYWEVPPHVLEDRELLFLWMTISHEVAVKAKHKKTA